MEERVFKMLIFHSSWNRKTFFFLEILLGVWVIFLLFSPMMYVHMRLIEKEYAGARKLDSQKKAYDGFVELKESMYSGDFDFDSFLALKEVQLHINRNIKLINFDEEKGVILAVYNCQDSGCAYTIFMKYEKFEV